MDSSTILAMAKPNIANGSCQHTCIGAVVGQLKRQPEKRVVFSLRASWEEESVPHSTAAAEQLPLQLPQCCAVLRCASLDNYSTFCVRYPQPKWFARQSCGWSASARERLLPPLRFHAPAQRADSHADQCMSLCHASCVGARWKLRNANQFAARTTTAAAQIQGKLCNKQITNEHIVRHVPHFWLIEHSPNQVSH